MKFVVTQNGRVIDRGFLSFQQAYDWANRYVPDLERHKMGTKIYTPDFEVKVDREDLEAENEIWRSCKRHRSIVRP